MTKRTGTPKGQPADAGTTGGPDEELLGLGGSDGVQEFVGLLRRRKREVLLALVLVPLVALGLSLTQQARYSASSSVLAAATSLSSALSDVTGLVAAEQPERYAATQVELARLPEVASRVVDAADLAESPEAFLARSSVTSVQSADILRFFVEDADPASATRLATTYAEQFTQFRRDLDVKALRSLRATIERRLAQLSAAGRQGTDLYAELARSARELSAAEAVLGSNVVVVQRGTPAIQVAPKTTRNVLLALFLGGALGVAIAFLVDRLDTRVRGHGDVEAIISRPVLAELPPPPVAKGAQRTVSMLEAPHSPYAESIRTLRANFEFANVQTGARTVMITSALRTEGKSTVASDLAVALARSGRTVALCDLDSRIPAVQRMFGLTGVGLVEVALGEERLTTALRTVDLTPNARVAEPSALRASEPVGAVQAQDTEMFPRRVAAGGGTRRRQASAATEMPMGRLDVLALGRRRPNDPGDFVGSAGVRECIAELSDSHDVVIVDTPPVLVVSDALTISEYVDATVLVAHLGRTRKPVLRRLWRLMAETPAPVLGVVLTNAPVIAGFGSYYGLPPERTGDGSARRRKASRNGA